MTCARSEVVREGEIGVYHCVHRCVRRAFLCGEDERTGRSFEHRRGWIRDRLKELSSIFAVEVGGFSVMANHVHAVLRTRPDLAAGFSAEELAFRWWRLYPKRRDLGGSPSQPEAAEIGAVLGDREGGEARVAELRARLANLSWFMRCLAEPIARRANKEDGCTGHFWEGRFKAQALLDERAALACGIYIDLNPIRAGIAQTPETSHFTSAKERIAGRQGRKKLAAARNRGALAPSATQARLFEVARAGASADRWLCPIGAESGFLSNLDLDGYLDLLDWTGRAVASGKRGKIPARLAPILERLQIDVDRWIDTVTRFGRWFHRAVGSAQALCAEAVRVGRRWLRGVGAARLAFGSS